MIVFKSGYRLSLQNRSYRSGRPGLDCLTRWQLLVRAHCAVIVTKRELPFWHLVAEHMGLDLALEGFDVFNPQNLTRPVARRICAPVQPRQTDERPALRSATGHKAHRTGARQFPLRRLNKEDGIAIMVSFP